jgi:type II secretory ATPase GspE/PulE/Tfp pilus assembly ATPase PilB-like protein
LYAGVRGQDLLRRNVITVENPIEYKVPLIRQTEVNTKAGYTFASAIRYFLRHDPDIILVGEIRDSETAQTALAAAETGHLVLSTLHTNNVFGTIPRLNSMGITDFMIADSLIGVVSQRLVRQICEHCKESYVPTDEERRYLRDPTISSLCRGRGCQHCAGTGYYGRTPIYEVLRVNDELAAAIARSEPYGRLREVAGDSGYRDMLASARVKLADGTTSVDEVIRALGDE